MKQSKSSKELYEEASKLEALVNDLRKEAHEKHLAELLEKPIEERIIYAAYASCDCGAGLAYDPASPEGHRGSWDCSDILLGVAKPKGHAESKKHSAPLPFAFYEVKSERQPSANGSTTRPQTT
jgi:hypothetical protein